MAKSDLFQDVQAVVSQRMGRIRKANTRPEMVVRRAAHALGYRFRLHRRDLPGTPDLVFPSRRKVIFVHGCFWHRHDCRLAGKLPTIRRDYWVPKLERNVERDRAAQRALVELGWDFRVIWECEIADVEAIKSQLEAFLGGAGGK